MLITTYLPIYMLSYFVLVPRHTKRTFYSIVKHTSFGGKQIYGKVYFFESFWCTRDDLILLLSVSTFGDLLDLGQIFKAYGNNLFALISQHS